MTKRIIVAQVAVAQESVSRGLLPEVIIKQQPCTCPQTFEAKKATSIEMGPEVILLGIFLPLLVLGGLFGEQVKLGKLN